MFKKGIGSAVAMFFFAGIISAAVPACAEEDDHYIQPDDYFISKDAFKDQDYINVALAKMKEAPKKETKSEAKFMQIADGKELWTKNYWKTRKADKADLKLGVVVIMLDAQGEEGDYRAPENKEDARTTSWFIAKITDLSDLYKDFVTVSGGYKVNIDALRVVVKEEPKK
ncbi:MAG: DUF4199 domain-containing protein [Spirochaetota bacterium]